MVATRLDPAVDRMYGLSAGAVHHARTVNDGPKVNLGRSVPPIPALRADRPPSVLVYEPVVRVTRLGMAVEWAGELGDLLAKRLTVAERRALCQALGARLVMDAYTVVHGMGEAEKAYALARHQALRAR